MVPLRHDTRHGLLPTCKSYQHKPRLSAWPNTRATLCCLVLPLWFVIEGIEEITFQTLLPPTRCT